jgi:hypothetical protein
VLLGAVDAVALAASIGGTVVGVAGVISGIVLAQIQRGQAVALAASQHVHERELARGDRLYERRAPTYEAVIGIIQTVMEHVEARSPLARIIPAPDLPTEPSVDDQRAAQIQLRTHGTQEASDAYQDWFRKVRSFQFSATTYENILAQGGAQLDDTRTRMEAARNQAREAADNLARLIGDELAGL